MTQYTKKDFETSNDVRWCPGCGDYAILTAVQKILPEIGIAPEQTVFISGIGCAGRFPYYMNTYGFHTIHGRAPAVASGLKLMRNDLSIWIVTGDGDGLSIGTNHLVHCLRRNFNVNILLFNNEIYGLTKGQFSPTSKRGQKTKTSPQGLSDAPLNPIQVALSAGATFVARAIDTDPKHLMAILKQAHEHDGASFVEIYQNCNIFNDGAFDNFAIKANRKQHTVYLNHDEKLAFGQDSQWALMHQNGTFIITDNHDAINFQHDSKDKHRAFALAELHYPDFPVPLGVFYEHQADKEKTAENVSQNTDENLMSLLQGSNSWQA